jgi:NTE family protein
MASTLFKHIEADKRYSLIQAQFSELKKNSYSDVKDKDGNQYVDLVQEGGGTLGLALVGYVWVLENSGIRFMSLAGTSAGAINTIAMAGLKKPYEPVCDALLDLVGDKKLLDFVDGGSSMKGLVFKAVKPGSSMFWLILRYALPSISRLKKSLGLNPGDDLLNWLSTALQKAGAGNRQLLEERMNDFGDSGIHNSAEGSNEFNNTVAVVTSEITTNSKVIFPQHAELFYDPQKSENPAEYARASMSIPFSSSLMSAT